MATRRILIKREGTDWSVLSEGKALTEHELHEAVANYPEVIPAEDLGLTAPVMTVGYEFQVGDGSIDMVAVDLKGEIVIVEFKKGDDRKVIAQLLGYGSWLWETSYQEFEGKALKYCKAADPKTPRPDCLLEAVKGVGDHAWLAEIMGAIARDAEQEFNPEAFKTKIEANLQARTFLHLYISTQVSDGIKRIAEYLSHCAKMRVGVIEVDIFGEKPRGVLVPRVIIRPGIHLDLTLEKLLERSSEITRKTYERLGELKNKYGWEETQGQAYFNFLMTMGGKKVAILRLCPKGAFAVHPEYEAVRITLGPLEKAGAPNKALQGYKAKLRKLPGFADAPGEPAIHLAKGFNEGHLASLIEATEEFIREVGSQPTLSADEG